MKVASPSEMRECDRITIQQRGVESLRLMERAGEGAARCARELLEDPAGKRVVVFCGKGNNGGDGLVVARYLHEWGFAVRVLTGGSEADIRGDARANLDRYRALGQDLIYIGASADEHDLERLALDADLVVDAIFGTGFQGQVGPPADRLIQLINRAPCPVLSLDVPSGVNGATGEAAGTAVRAARTVTFGLPKIGLLFHPGRELAGEVSIVDIGIPEDVVREVGVSVELVLPGVARALLPRRRPDAHKGDCGRVLVIGGSVGLTGAVALAATAAARAGAGLVTAAVPSSLNDILEVKITEPMTRPLPETTERSIALLADAPARELAQASDVVVLGPGLSRNAESAELARRLGLELPRPMVIDADGLNAFAGRAGELRLAAAPRVLTPHPGEAARLSGEKIGAITADPIAAARRLCAATGAVVVLKGATTVIADPEGRVRVNPTGNAGLATGGTGDVLSGLLGGLMAQGCAPADAAALAVYLHGAAGDLAADRLTQWSLVAGDLIDILPEAFYLLASEEETELWIHPI